jgi:hypothetical protein
MNNNASSFSELKIILYLSVISAQLKMLLIALSLNNTSPYCGRSAFILVTMDPPFVARCKLPLVGTRMFSTIFKLPKTVTLDWLSNSIQSRISDAWSNCSLIWAPAYPTRLTCACCEACDDGGLLILTEVTVLISDVVACAWLCWALLIAHSSLGLFFLRHDGDLCPALPQQ